MATIARVNIISILATRIPHIDAPALIMTQQVIWNFHQCFAFHRIHAILENCLCNQCAFSFLLLCVGTMPQKASLQWMCCLSDIHLPRWGRQLIDDSHGIHDQHNPHSDVFCDSAHTRTQVVLPLLSMSESVLLCISTLREGTNHYSKMFNLRNADGTPMFKSIQISLVCGTLRLPSLCPYSLHTRVLHDC